MHDDRGRRQLRRNLTDDPEVRHTEGGIARAIFRVAVSGRREQEPSFFTTVVWRDQAEHAAESLSKGSRVVVVGRLQQRAWTAEDGSARSVVEVVRGAGAKPAVGEGDHNQDDDVLAVSALGVRARPLLVIHGALLRRPLTARGVLVVSPRRLPHLLGRAWDPREPAEISYLVEIIQHQPESPVPAGDDTPVTGRRRPSGVPASTGECHTPAIETHQHAQSSRAGRRRSQGLVTTDRKARDHGN
jgi:hypothetical protein